MSRKRIFWGFLLRKMLIYFTVDKWKIEISCVLSGKLKLLLICLHNNDFWSHTEEPCYFPGRILPRLHYSEGIVFSTVQTVTWMWFSTLEISVHACTHLEHFRHGHSGLERVFLWLLFQMAGYSKKFSHPIFNQKRFVIWDLKFEVSHSFPENSRQGWLVAKPWQSQFGQYWL